LGGEEDEAACNDSSKKIIHQHAPTIWKRLDTIDNAKFDNVEKPEEDKREGG